MLTIKKRVAGHPLLILTFLGLFVFNGCLPPGPRNLLEGERLLNEGKLEPAIDALETATKLLPQEARAQNLLGLAYHQAGRTRNAIQAYTAALKLNNNLVAARYNLGCLYLENNNPAAAATELKTFTSLQPESLEGWKKRGLAALRLKQLEDAEKSYIQANHLNPKDPEVLNGIGILHFYHKRYRDAAAFFAAAAQPQPPYLEASLNLAIVSHQYLNNKALALEKYHSYISVHPRPANAPAVEEVMVRLDMELNPQKYATNQPPSMIAKTNAPGLTNTSAVAQVATTAPPVAAVATNVRPTNLVTLAEKPKITNAVNPAPPVVVAKAEATAKSVPEATQAVESPRKVAKPLPVPAVEAGKNETIATPPVTTTAAAPTTAEVVSSEPGANASKPVEKKGFFQRMNPLNLFRSQPKRTTPLATAKVMPTVTPTLVVETKEDPAAAPGKVSPVTLLPKPPAPVAHYAYRYPVKPEPGNRRDATPLFEQGLKAQRENNLPTAIEAYRSAVQADPAFFAAHFNLGLAAYEADDLPTALQAYETTLAIDPISVSARYNFALALQKGRYYREAANEFEKMLALAPGDIRGHLALANLYAQRLSERQAAREQYLTVLRLDPHHPQAEEIRYWLVANP